MTDLVAVTGTPGTGKTTATDRLAVPVVHGNAVVEREGLYTDRDDQRDSLVVDLDGLAEWVEDRRADSDAEQLVVESHLAHHLPADRVVVLRCAPAALAARLDGRESAASIEENADSEALDVILTAAVDRHGRDAVHEIDTTDRSPAVVADDIRAVIAGERDPQVGTVDFTDYLAP
jgi:adenylate kinase